MIKSKNITILGSGISGLRSAKLANKLGLNVFVSRYVVSYCFDCGFGSFE